MAHGLFEHFAAFDDSHIVAGRKAAAVTKRRLMNRFSTFLGNAINPADYTQRHSLVASEIDHIILTAADEFGLDGTSRENFISLLTEEMKTAKGGYCDECKAWKSGPRGGGCTCDGDNDADDDDDDHGPPDSDEGDSESDHVWSDLEKSERDASAKRSEFRPPFPVEPGQGVTDIEEELEKAPSAVGQAVEGSPREAAKVDTGDSTEKREKVEQEAGPSPKMDKKKWKPNALNDSGNLKPIETEESGSANPTVKQDPTDKTDWMSDDFLRDTDARSTTETLPTADESGQSTKRNITQSPTDTFGDSHGVTDPVTSEVMASTTPGTNPLREILQSEFGGFLPSNIVQSAIRSHEGGHTA